MSNNMSNNQNPYSQAAGVYSKNATHNAGDQRSMEGQILLKAAAKLQSLSDRLKKGEKVSLEEIDDTLTYNRKLWTVFASEAGNDAHPLPNDIKNNISNLAVFIFKRTMELMSDPTPEKIAALIDINRQIAGGLLKAPPKAATPPPSSAPSAKGGTDNADHMA